MIHPPRAFGAAPLGDVFAYTIKNEILEVTILNLGCIIQKFVFDGGDIVAGFDSAEDYATDPDYHGAVVGRYANRIQDAELVINGETFKLGRNEKKWNNHNHGGFVSFSRRIWTVDKYSETEVSLTYFSPDGEEGYPGNVNARVTYSLSGDCLRVDYEALSDKDTYLNLTNHSYFNIDGLASGDILKHKLMVNADSVSVFNESRIADGTSINVEGTPFDFRTPKEIGRDVNADFPLLNITPGYGQNFELNGTKAGSFAESFNGLSLPLACEYSSDKRSLSIYTDRPGLQVYTGGGLKGVTPFKGGIKQFPFAATALEPQYEPNACHFGRYLVRAREKYGFSTIYKLRRVQCLTKKI
jgi:aldose 1-epimerase